MSANAVVADGFYELHVGNQSYRICLPSADTDQVQSKIKLEQAPYELAMLQDMASRVQRGQLFVDIGANVGNHALYMAVIGGSEVVAFEPNPELCDALNRSANANRANGHLHVKQCALGAQNARGRYQQERPDNLNAQVIEVGDGEIEIVPLDSVHFDHPVALIKVTVGGMEIDVLRGATHLLTTNRPLVYVGCLDEKQFRLVSQFLAEHRYGYWDTFNASPTHLFIPNEQLTIEQRLSRLQILAEEGNYRKGYQLQETKRKLDDANKKYRTATEHIAQFKIKLTELTSEKQVLEVNLASVKDKLEAANLKYRDVTAQSSTLKSKISEHLDELSEARAQLTQTRELAVRRAAQLAETENELAVSKALAAQADVHAGNRLEDWQHWERETRDRCDAELAQLRGEAASVRRQLDEAHARFHVVEAERHLLERKGLELETDLQNAQVEQHRLNEELQAFREEHEKLTEHADKVFADLSEQSIAFGKIKEALENEQRALYDAGAEKAQLGQQLQSLSEEHARLAAHTDRLSVELAEQTTMFRETEARFENVRSSLKDEVAALLAQNELRSEEITRLNGEFEPLASAMNELRDNVGTLKSERDQLLLERQQLGSTISLLNAESKTRSGIFEQIKLDAIRHKVALSEANAQVERLRQQLLAANQQVSRTKSTLSFQLGHALIFGTKSFEGFRALPGRLWALHKLAGQRREEKIQKGSKLAGTEAKGSTAHRVAVNDSAAQRVADTARVRLKGLHNNSGDQLVSRLKALKVAAIMDEFTHGSYESECNLLQLTPAHWQRELDAFQPELLFIESAWRGKDELWGSKVGHMSQEIVGIVQWCCKHKVPTIFWNKEDPVHFGTFLSTAKQFDFVFTTDIDCIHRYKAALGHDRVFLLPFAAQPRINNPIEKFQRQDAFCFAGSYYTRYPDRIRDLGSFVTNLSEFRPVDIYDRNYGKNDPNYSFPEEYQPFIVGNLPYAEIDKAYKGYRYAINLNSIKQSQSMFARRIYELLASNTITISNYSRGVRLMFNDLVVTSDSGAEIKNRLLALAADDVSSRKLRLAGLRKVMSEHTYQDRLAYVIAKVSAEVQPSLLPVILVIGYAKDQQQVDLLLQAFERQNYPHKTLLLVVSEDFTPAGVEERSGVRLFTIGEANAIVISELAKASAWLSVMVPDDYYGEHYLTDLALATRYADAPVVGKVGQYVWSASKGVVLHNADKTYARVASVPARAGLARLDRLTGVILRAWVAELYTALFECETALAVDEFNYCRDGARLEIAARIVVDDLKGLDSGVPVSEMLARAEAISPEEIKNITLPQLSGSELANLFTKAPVDSKVTVVEQDGGMQVDSVLPDGEKEYWYAVRYHTPTELGATEGRLRVHLELKPGLNVQFALLFLDERKQRLGNVVKSGNSNHDIELPLGIAYLRLGLRISASGSARVQSLLLGHKVSQPAEIFGRTANLVLTNHYPSYDDLYRNGFVHTRMRAYRQHGIQSDVFRFRAGKAASYHEFEGTDVTTGGEEVLRSALRSGQYHNVFVHVLDEPKWDILKEFADRVKITVWVHGAEIQGFHRREFLYNTPEQRTAAIERSEKRLAFWRGILQSKPLPMHIVFVSKYLADTVMEDLGFTLPEESYSIIHNPIDTDHFGFLPKDPKQRTKVLSIRPYASAVYANDLSVKAILALSYEPFFKDMEFRMIGDGPLFEETLAPLKEFDNVIIERRFLSQGEISNLHKEYGIFLCPTRMDTQGVSRDEAMASGLVPITNNVAAIPEFLDDTCGILAPAEDSIALANGIAKLVNDSELFLRMSAEAARRVRALSSADKIISQEIVLFAPN